MPVCIPGHAAGGAVGRGTALQARKGRGFDPDDVIAILL